MKKYVLLALILTLLLTVPTFANNTQEEVDHLMIQVNGQGTYYGVELERSKELLFKERTHLVFYLNDVEFAEGVVGFNEDRTGLEFIWLPHTNHLEKPRYVKLFNQGREIIYSLEF